MKKETEVKETVIKTEPTAKKAAAPKAEAEPKKAVKKATTTTTRKKAAPKASEEVYVQFGGREWSVASLVEQARAAYAAQGHDAAEAKKISVYVKPEEGKAYYVVNDVDSGSVAL